MELENLENLIDLTISTEQGFLFNQLSKDTTDRPNVDSQTVLLLTQQYLRSSIPQCFNFMSEGLDGDTKGSSKSEVRDFQHS